MNNFQQKHEEEICSSRVGGFGGSDAALFLRVGMNGLSALTKTDMQRIRVAKGLEEYKPFAGTEAMQKGHDFEMWFEEDRNLKGCPLEREVKLKADLAVNFSTFAHADFKYGGRIYELKCTKEPEKAKEKYKAQLQWYYLLGATDVQLVTQDSAYQFGHHLQQQHIERDENMIRYIANGIMLIDEAWKDTDAWGKMEEITADDLLPFDREAVDLLNAKLRAIKVIEEEANTLKQQILAYMESNGIQSIKNEAFNITYIAASKRRTFDKKKLQQAMPSLDLSAYETESVTKPSIKITLK